MYVSRYMCLLMYLSTTRTPPVGTNKWRLLYELIIKEKIVKHRCNNMNHVFIEEVIIVEKYYTLINTLKCLTL